MEIRGPLARGGRRFSRVSVFPTLAEALKTDGDTWRSGVFITQLEARRRAASGASGANADCASQDSVDEARLVLKPYRRLLRKLLMIVHLRCTG
jgi:hypothetical protein